MMISAEPIPIPLGSDDTLPVLHPTHSRAHERSAMPEVDAAGRTDRGLHRSRNEDQFVIAALERRVRIRDASVTLSSDGANAGGACGLLLLCRRRDDASTSITRIPARR